MTDSKPGSGDPSALEFIGDGSAIVDHIGELMGETPIFAELEVNELRDLFGYMKFYRAKKGTAILREGEPGNSMLLLIAGKVDVLKRDTQNREKLITTVEPGKIIGEMSVVDGEPRFATCVASKPSVFAVLSRDALAQLLNDKPKLGAKVLVQLLETMAQRLRQTGGALVDYLKVS